MTKTIRRKPLTFKLHGGEINVTDVKDMIDSSYDKKGIENIGNYELDKDLSNRKAKVYHDSENNKTVVVNRGTTGTVSDWANNVRYVTGNYDNSDRLKQAIKTQKKAIEKYGNVDANIGHSQGAIITRKLNEKGLTDNVINYNPASLAEKGKKNEHVIRTHNDIVSSLHKNNKNTTNIKGSKNLLKSHGSKMLKQINKSKMFGGNVKSNTLSNTDIDYYMKYFNVGSYRGCYTIDDFPTKFGNDTCYIINLNGHSHWCALYHYYGKFYYYDSFGFPMQQEIEDIIGEDYYYSRNEIQNIDSSACGYYCIAFCKYLYEHKNKLSAYKKFVSLFSTDSENNDYLLNEILFKDS